MQLSAGLYHFPALPFPLCPRRGCGSNITFHVSCFTFHAQYYLEIGSQTQTKRLWRCEAKQDHVLIPAPRICLYNNGDDNEPVDIPQPGAEPRPKAVGST